MITFDGVSKTYHGRHLTRDVLKGVSFTIQPGDAVGLIGANGVGKSTLLRLIAGVEHPTAGRITRGMSISWPIGYSSCFQTSLTGADNARFVARIYGQPIEPLLAFVEEFAELGAYFHQPVKTYSSGMAARLAFALSLAIDFDCYLVDEVTAAGDARFRARCQDALTHRRKTGTLVMVSHDAETLKHYCKTGAVMINGRVKWFDTIEQALEVHEILQRSEAA